MTEDYDYPMSAC